MINAPFLIAPIPLVAFSIHLFVMTSTRVPTIIVTQVQDVCLHQRIATLLMLAKSQVVIQQLAASIQPELVTITMFALLIAVILKKDAATLPLTAMIKMHAQRIHATKSTDANTQISPVLIWVLA